MGGMATSKHRLPYGLAALRVCAKALTDAGPSHWRATRNPQMLNLRSGLSWKR